MLPYTEPTPYLALLRRILLRPASPRSTGELNELQ